VFSDRNHEKHLEGLLKHRPLGGTPEFKLIWDGVQEFALLTSYQVMLKVTDHTYYGKFKTLAEFVKL
jgi:hypothetical protein